MNEIYDKRDIVNTYVFVSIVMKTWAKMSKYCDIIILLKFQGSDYSQSKENTKKY